jgi:hypothetical protein
LQRHPKQELRVEVVGFSGVEDTPVGVEVRTKVQVEDELEAAGDAGREAVQRWRS